MSTKENYYVETGMGCSIVKADSYEQARRVTLREVGTYNGVQVVRKATEEDIAWVRMMQGRTE